MGDLVIATIILVLSLSIFTCLIFISSLWRRNSVLKAENESLKKELLETETKTNEIISIDPGDKAIIPDYGLSHTDTKHSFSVTYEVVITEVSVDKVKVDAVDYTSLDSFAKDPKNKQAILKFMTGKWVDKKSIELVVDEQMRRDVKLNQILS